MVTCEGMAPKQQPPKSWPIKLLNSWGINDDTKATNIVTIVSIILIIITIYIYIQILSPDVSVNPGDDDEVITEIL